MKQRNLRFARAALLSATAFLAAPALAQQTAPVTPPVAAPAPTPTVAPAPPPTAAPQAAPTSATGGVSDVPGADRNSTTPINPAAAAAAEAEAAERGGATSTAGRASRPSGSRPATVRRRIINAGAATRSPAPVEPAAASEAATPTDEPTPSPEAAAATLAPTPTPTPEVAPSVEETASAPVAAENAAGAQSATTESGGPPWLLIILGVLVVAGIAAFAMSRRRRDPDLVERPIATAPIAEPYVEPVAVAPVAVPVPEVEPESEPFVPASLAETPTVAEPTEPVDVAPALAEDATVEEPEDADVAALTAGSPAGDRPWLELAMRPIRAGTNVDQALVEIELTVGNAGTVAAEDVRISTFMLPAGSEVELDRLLSQSRVDAAVEPLTIAAGEGTRVDATLALPRAELMANDATTFQPVVVADARYRLPDGGEGRTSASFIVGIASDGDLGLFELDRPVLREDVEARLYREPARI